MLVFSTHAFTEGDVAVGVGVGMAAISTHAFTEGDRTGPDPGCSCSYFNSRLHGRRRSFDSIHPSGRTFQLTPSRKATTELWVWRVFYTFQLMPSRKATIENASPLLPIAISTHAFTEGDLGNILNCLRCRISTHAFTEGDCKFK